MKKCIIIIFVAFCTNIINAQTHKTENLIIVTLDGMRWQEIFGGADAAIINNTKYTRDTDDVKKALWSDSPEERRKKLLPFLWNVIAAEGQLYGNRNKGSLVNVTNPYKFSYPGYNEIFTGYPDTSVNSNDAIKNKNENSLEFINKQKGYAGKVAAFSTWGVAPYFLNKWRSGLYVNADNDSIDFGSPEAALLDNEQKISFRPTGERLDLITYAAAREYFKEKKPKVLYISFDETDAFAHEGNYNNYLGAAHAEDGMIADIWKLAQSMPEYKNKTTLIVTCDHGRGDKIKDQWRDHGEKVEDAGGIWIAAMGPDTKPTGEATSGQLYQRQLATTFAALLGFNFKPAHQVMQPIATITGK